jgi:hypothetical protein
MGPPQPTTANCWLITHLLLLLSMLSTFASAASAVLPHLLTFRLAACTAYQCAGPGAAMPARSAGRDRDNQQQQQQQLSQVSHVRSSILQLHSLPAG